MDRSENMRRIRSRDSGPELVVRKLLFRLGYRYRLSVKQLPGRPDIVLPRHRKIVFVHGCFWHVHQGCQLSHKPISNVSYWSEKLQRNVARDRAVLTQLAEMGWGVLVVWECETKDIRALEERLIDFVNRAQRGSSEAHYER
jgi:DNA mismatch endonuclease (patch repair protein)